MLHKIFVLNHMYNYTFKLKFKFVLWSSKWFFWTIQMLSNPFKSAKKSVRTRLFRKFCYIDWNYNAFPSSCWMFFVVVYPPSIFDCCSIATINSLAFWATIKRWEETLSRDSTCALRRPPCLRFCRCTVNVLLNQFPH